MMKEIKVPVVGLSHYMDNYDEFCENLVKDSYVFVSHERGNMYDEYAMMVTLPNGKQVGHISGKYSHQVYAGVGEKTVMARVIGGEHKSFDVRMMVDAEAYDNAQISTSSNEIGSQLKEGVIGLRNVLPTLLCDQLMEQAWTMIEMGREMSDETLVREGVILFGQHFGCSLCAEDLMRAKWIFEQGLDVDGVVLDRFKEMSDKNYMYESLVNQIEGMMNIDSSEMEHFRKRYVEACTGDSAVMHWLDTALDGQLRGCYKQLTVDMACFILYHKLSRIDIYILLSHLIAVKEEKASQMDIAEDDDAEKNEKLKAEIIKRIARLTPYIYINKAGAKKMEPEEFVTRLNDLFTQDKEDNFTAARKGLWKLLTEKFPRDNKEDGIDRIVIMNLIGKINENKYFMGADDFLAKIVYDHGNNASDGNNIGRAFDAQRYTTDMKRMVDFYFP